MTRDSQLPSGPDDDQEPSEPSQGNLRTTGPGLLVGVFLAGLVLGRLIRPVALEISGTAPRVGLLASFALFFLAAAIGYLAYSTHRTLQRDGRHLLAHQAVNRLVLAKSCAIAGALLAGGYLGYAISWIGQESELGQERLVHSLLAAVAGVTVIAGSLALERACRVRRGPPTHLP